MQGHCEPGAYPRRFGAYLGNLGEFLRWGTPWIGQPIANYNHTHSYTYSHIMDNLEIPISLQSMSVDYVEDTGVPGENP